MIYSSHNVFLSVIFNRQVDIFKSSHNTFLLSSLSKETNRWQECMLNSSNIREFNLRITKQLKLQFHRNWNSYSHLSSVFFLRISFAKRITTIPAPKAPRSESLDIFKFIEFSYIFSRHPEELLLQSFGFCLSRITNHSVLVI